MAPGDIEELPSRQRRRTRIGSQLPTPSTSGESEPSVLVACGWKRVAWPTLRPLPLETSSVLKLPIGIQEVSQVIIQKARDMVQKYNLLFEDEDDENDFNLEMRQQRRDSATAIPTLIINAPWSREMQHAWVEAVQELVIFLRDLSRNSGNRDHDIHVEIIAPELQQTTYYDDVSEPFLLGAWDSVMDMVYKRLQLFEATKDHMTTIALEKYGVDPDRRSNPPTIYISVDYSSDETQWLVILTDIKSTIDSVGWNHVQVHIEHNLNMHCAFDLLPPTGDTDEREALGLAANKRLTSDYSQVVKIGDDLGPSHYVTRTDGTPRDPGNGTVGCLVQIKSNSHPNWRTFILTNYHVVRSAFDGFTLEPAGTGSRVVAPPKSSDLWKIDKNGYIPNSKINSQPVAFESPSRSKHNFTIWHIDNKILSLGKELEWYEESFRNTKDARTGESLRESRDEIAALNVEKQQKLKFFDDNKQVLGELYAASGFRRRSPNNRRLDWALLKLDASRQGSNRLPNREVWTPQLPLISSQPFKTFGMILKDQSRSIEDLSGVEWSSNGSSVYKVGATTRATTAESHKAVDTVTLIDDKHLKVPPSKELAFGPKKHYDNHGVLKFCAHGDSGSVVFDDRGGIVGLLFRGHRNNKSFDDGYGYVTPIEHVFQDIKDFSKGQITDIRIAPQ